VVTGSAYSSQTGAVTSLPPTSPCSCLWPGDAGFIRRETMESAAGRRELTTGLATSAFQSSLDSLFGLGGTTPAA
jgi:hypothetical protein